MIFIEEMLNMNMKELLSKRKIIVLIVACIVVIIAVILVLLLKKPNFKTEKKAEIASHLLEENATLNSFGQYDENSKDATSTSKEQAESNVSFISNGGDNSSQQSLNSTASSSILSATTDEQQIRNITLTEANQIAEDLISKYHQFSFSGVCCELEYSDLDMSEFLSQAQKVNYYYSQYKITCCNSIESIKQHIFNCIDKSLVSEFNSENFFYNDKGNLYIFLTPLGILGYGNISVSDFSANKIEAKAELEDIDGPTGVYDAFIIENKGENFLITAVERKSN